MRKQLMKCRHGRTYARGCTECTPPQVTETGRAISVGRVTRASLGVKRQSAKPLPIELQCHPKALSRTSRNPGCIRGGSPHWGLGYSGLDITREQILRGYGLRRKGRFDVVRTTSGTVLGRTDDVTLAMAYKVRAAYRALYLEVVDNAQ